MESSASVDLSQVARELNLPPEAVERTVALLDENNTVPFITRFRKDHTGGLDEEQIRAIGQRVAKLRMLAERKQTIRKSIESQNKLTDELAALIEAAGSTKRLEDLYLPFKPKKQTLTDAARERGLEPLSEEILAQDPAAADIDQRATAFVDPEKGIGSPAEVLLGVGHLIAEHFSENAELRGKLRKVLWRTGKLVTAQVPPPKEEPEPKPAVAEQPAASETTNAAAPSSDAAAAPEKVAQPPATEPAVAAEVATSAEQAPVEAAATDPATPETSSEQPAGEAVTPGPTEPIVAPSAAASSETVAAASEAQPEVSPAAPESSSEEPSKPDQAPAPEASPQSVPTAAEAPANPTEQSTAGDTTAAEKPSEPPAADQPALATEVAPAVASKVEKPAAKPAKEKKKKKKKPKQDDAFKDYYTFSEGLTRLPPHRIMAINRGERAKAIRVRIDCDEAALLSEAEQILVPENHAHVDFLKSCVQDCLTRLVMPSLQREARRELTEKAEDHAIEVFAQNLRKLLLQPPLRGRRVLAVDPGFRSGCKIAVVDAFGEVLDHATVHVVGREERRKSGRSLLVGLLKKYKVSVVAIGNGAASREAEQLVSAVINDELKEFDVSFVIVNEAGASVYSTSPVGREEFPKYDPTVRSAISIARRLLDPLSELVKISPAHIGVGMYQHDVKSKHLRETLDSVVESCVNYVGVDANTASPSLLRYVSGLNQLHARRIYEYRQQKGPYRNRGELQNAPHIGEMTYHQAAGFLKIHGAEHPLDVTWIHPESYDLAEKVLEKVGVSLADLTLDPTPAAAAFGLEQGKVPTVSENPEEAASTTQGDSASEEPQPAAPTQPTEEPAAVTEAPAEPVATEPTPADTPAAEASPAAEPSAPQPVPAEAVTEPTSPESTTEDTTVETTTPEESAPAEAIQSSAAGNDSAVTAEPSEASAVEQGTPSPEAAESAAPEAAVDPGQATEASEAPAAAEAEPAPVVKREKKEKKPTPAEIESEKRAAASAEWNAALARQRAKFEALAEKVSQLNVAELATELGVGQLSLEYLLKAICRPGRDPRDDLPQPVLRRGILKLEDLKPGMELTGSVLNVVDFGAFVDIGLTDSGLVHISRLADRYVSDPHEVVSVGDVIQVWVMEVDARRRRVSLTAIEPGTEKPKQERSRGFDKKSGTGDSSRAADGKSRQRRDRPPRRGKGGHDRQAKAEPRAYVLDAQPKQAKPLKKKVLEGKEPMRSFSDLVQFLEKKEEPDSAQKKKKKK